MGKGKACQEQLATTPGVFAMRLSLSCRCRRTRRVAARHHPTTMRRHYVWTTWPLIRPHHGEIELTFELPEPLAQDDSGLSMGQVSRDGVKEERLGIWGAARYMWPNLSVLSVAMELMTNAIQVGISPIMMRALALLLGYG